MIESEKTSTIIEAKNLYKSFGNGEGATLALKNVSLSVNEGELLVILGSSGSGKSTLLNLIGGMDKADSGSVIFDGNDLSQMKDKELTQYRRNSVGFVFQSFNLISELTAFENLSLINSNAEECMQALNAMGLDGKAEKYPSQLSGGEQQRISIARALVRMPRILLCDEPTGALDYETGRQILVQIEKACRLYKRTVIFVTHTRETAKMADRVITLRSGEIISDEINSAILSARQIEW